MPIQSAMIAFPVVVFILFVGGMVRPSRIRIPDRQAAIWMLALAFGLLFGGGMLNSPQNGNMTALDAPRMQAVDHLRTAANCLHFSRSMIVWSVDMPNGSERVGTVLSECGMAFNGFINLVPEARRLASDAVNKVDLAVFGRTTDQAGMGRAVDNVITGLDEQIGLLSN